MSRTLLLSQHSSNPLDVGSSDPQNRQFLSKLAQAQSLHGPDSSDDPISGYPPAQLSEYHTHLAHILRRPSGSVLPGFSGARSNIHTRSVFDFEDDQNMESDDQLLAAYEDADADAEHATPRPQDVIVVDGDEDDDIDDDRNNNNTNNDLEHDEDEDDYNHDHEDEELDEEHQEDSDAEMDDLPSADSEHDAYSSGPDEELTILDKPPDEQSEIQAELADLLTSVPQLQHDYKLIDRLGTGTFSSVYKALDLGYHDKWDNSPWEGHHPPSSSAHYQSRPHARGAKVYVAIKRIYVTSSPERIRNELAIMAECRGCRHVSQLITAYRSADQVVVIMPFNRNDDFREFYRTLSIPGIKAYMRCMFRALRDVHMRGIIHRDVKPANFLFDPRTGIGTLCDFGLASRMEHGLKHGGCLHTGPSTNTPHGQYIRVPKAEEGDVKHAQVVARDKGKLPSERVGYPETDTRPVSKANRAGTRGFRAPEVLLKCGDQTGAIDVWAAGVIMLFFLTGKFPIFQSNDDIEALMEIAAIFGRKRMEKTATLHSRTFATNVPSITDKGIEWRDFVEKQNLDLYTPREPDLRHYPYNTPAYRAQLAAYPPPPPPASSSPDSRSSDAERFSPDIIPTTAKGSRDWKGKGLAPSVEAHKADVESALNLLERLLDPESVKRMTPKDALDHPFLKTSSASSSVASGSKSTVSVSSSSGRSTSTSSSTSSIEIDLDSDSDLSPCLPPAPALEPDEEPDDDEHVPHLFGQGVCGERHFFDAVTEEPCVRVAVGCGCGSCGMHEEVRTLLPGEGIAIGRMPCEFHREEFGY